MTQLRVAVYGALGKMGQEVVKALCHEPGMEIVGAVDLKAASDFLYLPDGSGTVPLAKELNTIITSAKPEVIVDFTNAKAAMPMVKQVTENKINLVIGSTGFSAEDIKEIERLAKANQVGVVIAPNFALGAVLMMHLAKIAGKHLDFAEIIELHHERKLDAPSGTALSTAKAMAEARGKPFSEAGSAKPMPSRGKDVKGIKIHSVRLPGLLAHQEVLLGAAGQTLSIRHDTTSRECYMPGVMLAVKEVAKRKGLTYRLDALLGL